MTERTNKIEDEQRHCYGLIHSESRSFEYLYKAWSGKIYNFVLRISNGDTFLAEEIVQIVFVKVWEGRKNIDPEKSFGAYLCTIAKNQLITMYQKRMQELLSQEKMQQAYSGAVRSTEEEVEYRLLDEYIQSLVEQLPPARKQIFVLSRQKNLSNKEIATQLHLSENTVESQLSKAIAFLREKIMQHYHLSLAVLLYHLFNS